MDSSSGYHYHNSFNKDPIKITESISNEKENEKKYKLNSKENKKNYKWNPQKNVRNQNTDDHYSRPKEIKAHFEEKHSDRHKHIQKQFHKQLGDIAPPLRTERGSEKSPVESKYFMNSNLLRPNSTSVSTSSSSSSISSGSGSISSDSGSISSGSGSISSDSVEVSNAETDQAPFENLAKYTFSGEGISYPFSNEEDIQAARDAEFFAAQRANLAQANISFDTTKILESLKQSKSALEKVHELKALMPEIEESQIKLMAGFVELNRFNFSKITSTQNMYLRREVTGFPFSLLITKEGHMFWQLKRKASSNPFHHQSAFKVGQLCVEHDSLKLCFAGTLSYDRYLATWQDQASALSVKTEIEYGQKLQNLPNVANFIESVKYEGKRKKSVVQDKPIKILVVQEYYSMGDLSTIIEKDNLKNSGHKILTEARKTEIAKGVINGGVHIHEQDVIHGDYKPANIFLGDNYTPYVGDFGCSRGFYDDKCFQLEAYEHPAVKADENNIKALKKKIDRISSKRQNADSLDPSKLEKMDKTLQKLKSQYKDIQIKSDVYAMGLTLAQMECGLKVLPWESTKINTKGKREGNGGIKKVPGQSPQYTLENALNRLYADFPTDTPRQKLIKIMINPRFEEIPTLQEVKTLSENL